MEFINTQFIGGRSVRLFKVIKSFDREALTIEIDVGLPSGLVTRALHQIIKSRDNPEPILPDLSFEYISAVMTLFL